MRRSGILLLLTAIACAPVDAPAPRTAPPPAARRFVPVGQASRVVLLSLDGLSADGLTRHMPLRAFDRMQRDGAVARVIPVNPTSTSSTHVSMLTGADPQRHGIVGNRFHLPGTPVQATARGLDTHIDVETIVETARRQGKRVGAVSFPGVDGRNASRRADFGLVWTPMPAIPPRIVTLTRSDFHREWTPPTWTPQPLRRRSFSPVMRARVEWVGPERRRADVDIVAYDTSDDGVENFDAYFVEADSVELPLDRGAWFAVSRSGPSGRYGSWSKLIRTTPSLDVTIYWGGVSRTDAYPESFQAMLDAEVGFWPGGPDEASEIDEETFAEQIERLSDFLTRAQTLTIERMEFDLLLAYQGQIDLAAHNFLGYDDGVVAAAFASADRAVASLRDSLDLTRDALIVTGDHGYAPVEREIRMNRLLADLGLAGRWRAWTAGGVAHLYRFGEPDDTASVASRLSATGHFERIDGRQPGSHRNRGDLVVWAAPGTVLSAYDDPPVVAEPGDYGQHGALNTHREMHTVLFAAGAGVPAGSFGELRQTAIARFVATLLAIQPPAAAE